MKKLLLILFISFAFISSAYANSIEGAFGYKLGEELNEDIKIQKTSSSEGFNSWKFFIPKKPFPFFEKYLIYTTLIDKKIWRIVGVNNNFVGNSCTDELKGFPYILSLLDLKYGEPQFLSKLLYDDKKAIYKSNDIFFNGEKKLNKRTITIECSFNMENSVGLIIEYKDKQLELLASKEGKEMLKQKLLEESSEYDF